MNFKKGQLEVILATVGTFILVVLTNYEVIPRSGGGKYMTPYSYRSFRWDMESVIQVGLYWIGLFLIVYLGKKQLKKDFGSSDSDS